MARFSFGQYMDHAIGSEHARPDRQPGRVPLVGQADSSTLAAEAKLVSEALVAVFFAINNNLYRLLENREVDSDEQGRAEILGGWDLGGFAPYLSEDPRARLGNSILLGDDGNLYRYRHLAARYSRRARARATGPPNATRGLYLPEAAPPEDNERVRYGLAGLVARYELELPE